jgi:thiol-disulfide isomerase/thioredoxin
VIERQSLKEFSIRLESSLGSNEIFFVDFYSPWCILCDKIKPVIKEIAEMIRQVRK